MTTTADAISCSDAYVNCSTYIHTDSNNSRLCYARVRTILFIFYPDRLSSSRPFDSTNSNVYCHQSSRISYTIIDQTIYTCITSSANRYNILYITPTSAGDRWFIYYICKQYWWRILKKKLLAHHHHRGVAKTIET